MVSFQISCSSILLCRRFILFSAFIHAPLSSCNMPMLTTGMRNFDRNYEVSLHMVTIIKSDDAQPSRNARVVLVGVRCFRILGLRQIQHRLRHCIVFSAFSLQRQLQWSSNPRSDVIIPEPTSQLSFTPIIHAFTIAPVHSYRVP